MMKNVVDFNRAPISRLSYEVPKYEFHQKKWSKNIRNANLACEASRRVFVKMAVAEKVDGNSIGSILLSAMQNR